MIDVQKRTWAEIHMDRLEENYKTLRRAAPGCAFTGLVKANAYGHGAPAVAKRLEVLGCECLAVACLDEAVELRKADVKAPILILGHTEPHYAWELARFDLTQTVYDGHLARDLSRLAVALGVTIRCHLKVDTGMGRLGLVWEGGSDVEELVEICQLPNLKWEGVFTHFSDADGSADYSQMQLDRFRQLLEELEGRGIRFPLRHCSNGAATLNFPAAHLDMVRPGLPLYGLYPEPGRSWGVELKPVMELKTHIVSVKTLPAGTCISYGRTFTLERESRVAVVPVGYADGLLRSLSGKMEMLVRGKRVPQIGRICMDMCMLDVTDVPGVEAGDVATIFGDGVPIQDLADAADTIPYELMCAVAPRVPRIYLD